MDRATALHVLGLPPDASRRRVRRAYGRMRSHLMDRALEAPGVAEKTARLAEIQALENALASDLWAPSGISRVRLAAAGASLAAGLGLVAWALLGRGGPATVPEPPPVTPEPPVAESEPPAPPEPAALAVRSPVEGASFRLTRRDAPPDEAPLASGPADGTFAEFALPAGQPVPLVLQVTHPDCGEGARREVELRPGERREVEAQPCPDTGWLVVRSNVGGDRLSVDGRAFGPTSPERHPLRVGDYALRVEKPGYGAWSDFVRIAPGEVLTRRARLAPEAPTDLASAAASRVAAQMPSERGGTHDWFDSVSRWMVAHHDTDGTGLIDTPQEVAGIPCATFQALEMSYETGGLGAPMSRLYGFDGSRWVPGALGFDVRVRDQAYERMRACGLR